MYLNASNQLKFSSEEGNRPLVRPVSGLGSGGAGPDL